MNGRALEHGIALAVDHGGTSSSKMYVGGQANADVAAGTTTASSTAENTCTEYEIPADTLVAGSTIRVRFFVYVLDNNGTDTLQVGLRLGENGTASSNAGMLSAPTDVADGDALVGDCTFVVRTAGVSGTMIGFGTVATGTAGSKLSMATDQSGAFAATAIDTTVLNYLNVTTLFNASHADNEATTEAFVVDIVNPST
jgi:hypothetical protein